MLFELKGLLRCVDLESVFEKSGCMMIGVGGLHVLSCAESEIRIISIGKLINHVRSVLVETLSFTCASWLLG